jgi:hypothetical protein
MKSWKTLNLKRAESDDDDDDVERTKRDIKLIQDSLFEAIERADLDQISELFPIYVKESYDHELRDPLRVAITKDQIVSLICILNICSNLKIYDQVKLSFVITNCIKFEKYEMLHTIVDKFGDNAKKELINTVNNIVEDDDYDWADNIKIDFDSIFDPIENYDIADISVLAIKQNNYSFVEKHLTSDNVNLKNGELIQTAVMYQNIQIVRLLISFGAKVNSDLLELAIKFENTELVKIILDHDPDTIGLFKPMIDDDPKRSIVNLLVERGADPTEIAVQLYNGDNFHKFLRKKN